MCLHMSDELDKNDSKLNIFIDLLFNPGKSEILLEELFLSFTGSNKGLGGS